MTDLEQRLQRLEDRAALDDLVARYFLAADGDDLAGVRASFTEDATFSVSGALCGTGRHEVVDFIASSRTNMGLTLHTANYALFTFEEADRASGVVGAHLELVLGGEMVFGAVRYEDEYLRENGAWRIATRNMRTIHIAPWADVGKAFASQTPVRWPGAPEAASDYPRR